MPNWCNNVVELAHEDPKMIERARDAFNRGELLQEFCPVPEDLKIVAGRVGEDSDQAQKDLVAQEEANLAKFGYSNWYDYCVNEWGTKWDVGLDGGWGDPAEIQEDGRLTLSFDSAWSPPLGAYEKLCDLGFSVRGYYFEGGMMFAGVWDDGYDDYVELGGLSSEQIKEEIPEALDEMFGISETIAEYEQEESDAE
jgi:hypothetical protein